MKFKLFFITLFFIFVVLASQNSYGAIIVIKGTSTTFTNTMFSSFLSQSNTLIHVHNFDGKTGKLNYKEMKKRKPEMIIAIGETPVAEIASNFSDIYIISIGHYDTWSIKDIKNVIAIPVEMPASLSIPLIKKLLPKVHTIGVLYNPRLSSFIFSEFKNDLKSEGVELAAIKVDAPEDVYLAIKAFKNKIDLFYFIPDPTVFQEKSLSAIFSFLIENNTPYITPSEFFLRENGIMALNVNPVSMGRFVHRLSELIIKEKKKKEDLNVIFRRLEVTYSLSASEKFGIKNNQSHEFYKWVLDKGYTLMLVE